MRLQGKVAVITGGARGIGGAIACEFAREGVDVCIFDIAPPDNARPVLQEIASVGRKAVYVQGGVEDRQAVMRMLDSSVRELGGVDILVNNAACSIRAPLLELSVEDIERTWNVTLWGVLHCSQLTARQMVAQGRGGNIISISSVHACRPFPNSTAYDAAKAAVNHMSAVWAAELAPHRIRVNVIEPGWIDTPGERRYYTEQQLQEEGAKLPMGRLGRAEEIARAAVYLASNDASYVTGTVLRIDGGFVLTR